jgi:hypothetical protein
MPAAGCWSLGCPSRMLADLDKVAEPLNAVDGSLPACLTSDATVPLDDPVADRTVAAVRASLLREGVYRYVGDTVESVVRLNADVPCSRVPAGISTYRKPGHPRPGSATPASRTPAQTPGTEAADGGAPWDG